MSPKAQRWAKLALAGILTLVTIGGLYRLPEVRSWYSPEGLRELKVWQLQEESRRIGYRLKRAGEMLETLNKYPGKGLARSWKRDVIQVQKDWISATVRLKYFNAELETLKGVLESKVQAAAPAEAASLTSMLDRIKEMQLQSVQFGLGLEYTLEKLRTTKLALANRRASKVVKE